MRAAPKHRDNRARRLLQAQRCLIFLAAIFFGAVVVADPDPAQIGPPQPVVTPDTIRAAREKFEREYKLNTARPWDGMYSTRPVEPESRPSSKPKE